MAEILVLGAGLNGLTTAMLLAKDGHEVTVLERDAAESPGEPTDAWQTWERRGVNQFRLGHFMLPRWTAEMRSELPEVVAELEALGGLRFNGIASMPEWLTGGTRDGDNIFETVTGRRPVIETAVAAVASRTDGVTVRRGIGVTGLTTGVGRGSVPHVTGVLLEGGEALHADLVVDACGRRSSLPAWLDAIGARRPIERREDCGFVYYGRHFRSPDGSLPENMAGVLQDYPSLSVLTLPADNGTWAVVLVTSAQDRELRVLRDVEAWERALAQYPFVAHWGEGESIDDGVAVMAAIEDRHRRYVVGEDPVATGIVAVGDSWACTNPSLGRGTSIGILHAQALRDVLRDFHADEPEKLVRRFDEVTVTEIEPLYRMTLAYDHHRLAEIQADIEGRPYVTADPAWILTKAMSAVAPEDPEVLRAYLELASLLAVPTEVMARPGMFPKLAARAQGAPQYTRPGPDRAGLLAVLDG